MIRVRWCYARDINGELLQPVYHEGVSLGPVKDKQGNTLLVVKCMDGTVREVPIGDIEP